jgi:hypothetical protein
MKESVAKIGWVVGVGLLFVMPFVILVLFAVATSARAQDAPKGPPQYMGVEKCAGVCHKTEKQGKQLAIWQESAHAKAWATLATPEAKEIAKKKGIEDPQKSEKCAKCHTTAYGADAKLLTATFKVEDGVGCETCHGPGSNYKTLKIMKDRALAVQNGMIVPDEKTCVKCHNAESPTHKKFVFAEAYKKIAHPVPKEAGK